MGWVGFLLEIQVHNFFFFIVNVITSRNFTEFSFSLFTDLIQVNIHILIMATATAAAASIVVEMAPIGALPTTTAGAVAVAIIRTLPAPALTHSRNVASLATFPTGSPCKKKNV